MLSSVIVSVLTARCCDHLRLISTTPSLKVLHFAGNPQLQFTANVNPLLSAMRYIVALPDCVFRTAAV